MPISDEIIELAPVKKTKSKLIVMFVAMGVLLALAVTFLVLFLLKPSVEDIDGRVNGVSVESSSLFAPSSSGDDAKLYASVGNPYTVYVNVSAEGVADPEVNWDFAPNTAVADVTSGKVEGSDNRYFCTFTPLASYADNDQPITITARSKSDTTKTSQIVFYAVNQGTDNIRFIEYWANRNPAPTHTKFDNSDPVIELTYYRTSLGATKNNVIHLITFEQLGAEGATAGEYSKITLTGIGTDSPSNKITVVSSKPDVVDVVGISENASTPNFEIIAKGVSDEPVILTVTANVNNGSDPVEKKIKVNVKSNEQRGIINNIFVYDELVNEQFFAAHTNSNGQLVTGLPAEIRSLTLAYKSSYDDLLSHVLLDPVSLQYDKEKGIKPTDWYEKLSVSSTNESVIAVKIGNGGRVTIEARDLSSLGAKANKCSIIIADRTNPSVRKEIPVQVVAQNQSGAELSVTSPSLNGSNYDHNTIIELNKKNDGIPTSPKIVSAMTVTYKLTAPANSNVDEIVSNRYLSLGFDVEYDTDIFTVKILNSDVKDLKTKEFSDQSLKCQHDAGENFTATATFDIAVNPDVPSGVYTITFKKIGTGIAGADEGTVNKYDRDFALSVNFNISTIATRAEFKSEKDAAPIINKLHKGYLIPSSVRSEEIEGKTIYKQDANLYLQNCAEGTTVMFLEELITTNGSTNRIESGEQSSIGSNGALRVTTASKKVNVSFLGKNDFNAANVQARILFSVYDNGGQLIAELTLSVYVFNAYNSLSVVTNAQNPDIVYYDADNHALFARDNLTVGFAFGNPVSYDMNADDVEKDMYLGYGNTYFDSDVENNGNIVFKYNNDTIVTYNKSSSMFTVNKDLYEYSYNNADKIDFSKLFVEYRVRTENYHEHLTDIAIASCTRQFTFVRKADNIRVFSDSKNESSELRTEGENLILPVQRGERSSLYPSAVVKINVNKVPTSITVLFDNTTRASVETVYVELGVEAITDFTAIDNGASEPYTEHGYTALVFRAPTIEGNQKDYSVKGTSTRGGVGCDITVRVLNQARPVSELHLYSDDKYSKELTALDFGKYNVGDGEGTYGRIVYIQAQYEDYNKSEHTKYEPVSVILPDYLLYSTDDVNYYDASSNAISIANSAGIESTDPMRVPLYLRLKPGATATVGSAGDVVVVRAEYDTGDSTTQSKREKRATVNVGTGLGSLVVKSDDVELMTVSANDTQTYNYTFALKNATDAQTLKLDLDYIALTKDFGNGSIAYDSKNITVTSAAVSGLILEGGNVNGEKPYVTLGVDIGALKTMSNVPFTLTFTDTAKGSTAEFTVVINVTVTMDIFALATGEQSYAVTTTGGESGVQSIGGNIVYNNGNDNIKPNAAGIDYSKLKVRAVDAQGNAVVGVGAEISADNGSFTLNVSNSILSSIVSGAPNYFVKLVYGDIESAPVPVVITTSANGIRVADGNDIAVANGRGDILVKSESAAHRLAVTVYNRGTNEAVSDTVSYKLYSDPERKIVSTVANIDVNGNITFIAGAQTENHGTLYYRASGGGVDFDVDIAYTFDVKSVELSNDVLSDGKIVLYYDRTNCTTLDLERHISVKSMFGIEGLPAGANISVESADKNKLTVNGYTYTLTPKGVGITAIDITVKRGDTSVVKTYVVDIIEVNPSITPSVTTVNIVDTDKLTVAIGGECAAFDSTVVIITKTPYTVNGQEIIIDRSNLTFGVGGNYADITISASVSYTLKRDSLYGMNGAITRQIDCAVKVIGEYNFDFDLTTDGTRLPEISAFENGKQYAIEVVSPKTGSDWKYSATVTPQIGNIGLFENGKASFTFGGSDFGSFKVVVTAKAYSKEYVSEKTYTVNNGAGATTVMSYTKDGYETTLDNSAETAVSAEGTTLTYKIDARSVTTADIPASAVSVLAAGSVTVGDVQKSGNVFTVTLTPAAGAGASSKLVVSGKFTVGGITYYTDEYKVRLTATAPEFAFASTVPDGIVMGDSVTLAKTSLQNTASGFVGDYSVVYTVVGGSEFASITGGVLTALDNLTSNKTVTVRATVTVSGGAFDGFEYIVDKQITLVVPTVAWDVTQKTVNVGGSVSVDSSVGSDIGGLTGYVTEYSYAWTEPVGYESSDYTDSGKTLAVASTDRTKAGGKFTVVVTMTVKKNGATLCSVNSRVLDVVVVPTYAKANEYTIFGAAGTYNIKNAVALYTLSGDGFINSDTEYVVSYALGTGSTVGNVSVNGDILTLAQNAYAAGEIKLTADVTITSGVYKGYVLRCDDVAVKVFGRTLTAVQSELTTDGTAYKQIDVAEMIGGGNIRSINAVALTNPECVSISDNNTSAPKIDIDLRANLVGRSGSMAEIVFGFEVQKTDNTTEYIVVTVKTVAVTPVLEYVLAGGSAELYGLQSFVVTVSEKHGLDVENIRARVQSAADLLTYTVSGNTVEFTAAVVNMQQSDTVFITADICGISKEVGIAFTVKPISVSVAFDADGGSTVVSKDYIYGATYGALVVPIKAGYVFDGWFAADGTRISGSDGVSAANLVSPENHTLYARWTAKQIEITLTATNGTLSTDNITVTFGETYAKLNNVTVTPAAGYRFEGWYYGDVLITDATKVADENLKSLTARITQITHRVTLSANGGTFADGSTVKVVDIIDGGNLGSYTPTHSNSAHTFKGWYNGTTADATEITSVTSDIVAYAQWNVTEYTVTYKHNYGSVADEKKNYYVGDTVTQLYVPTTRPGYTFDGWYESSDNGVTLGDKITSVNAATTLYAKWTKNKYTVTLDANGGTVYGVSEISLSVEYDSELVLPVPVKEGYTYEWQGATVTDGKITVTGDVTLTAKWKGRSTFTVTYNHNYTGSTDTTIDYYVGDTVTQLYVPTTRTGYTFDGWYESSDNGVTLGDKITSVNAATTLYAKWTKNKYTVTLDANGGTVYGVSEISLSVEYGSELVLPVPIKEGYIYEWQGATVTDGKITVTGDVTLTAKWKGRSTFTVTYNHNYTGSTDTTKSYYVGDTVTQLYVPTTRPGYTFDGWYESSDNGVTLGNKITSVSAATTLYAKWTPDNCVITLEAGEGTVGGVSQMTLMGKYDANITLPTPVRTGYTFMGWNTADGADDFKGAYLVKGDVTLTACWEIIKLTVTKKNGYDDNVTTDTVDYGNEYGVPADIVRDENYKFDGWYYYDDTAEGGYGEAYTAVELTEDITLIAKWTEKI